MRIITANRVLELTGDELDEFERSIRVRLSKSQRKKLHSLFFPSALQLTQEEVRVLEDDYDQKDAEAGTLRSIDERAMVVFLMLEDLIRDQGPRVLDSVMGVRDLEDLKRLMEDLQKSDGIPDEQRGDTQLVEKLSDGYSLVRLMTENAVLREGALMQNCLRRDFYSDAVEQGKRVIYSLRDRSGNPHVTLEARPRYPYHVIEFKGKQDRQPKSKYMEYLEELQNSFENEWTFD